MTVFVYYGAKLTKLHSSTLYRSESRHRPKYPSVSQFQQHRLLKSHWRGVDTHTVVVDEDGRPIRGRAPGGPGIDQRVATTDEL